MTKNEEKSSTNRILVFVVASVLSLLAFYMIQSATSIGQQINYLQNNEQEILDEIKNDHPKIESIQWNWGAAQVRTVQPDAGGIPVGEKYRLIEIFGKFNQNNDTFIKVSFHLGKKDSLPNIKAATASPDNVRILKDGAWRNLE